jgi:hypothetical protein
LLLAALRTPAGSLKILLAFVVGVLTVVTAYNFYAETFVRPYFFYLLLAISCAGIFVFLSQLRRGSVATPWTAIDNESVIAGAIVALSIAPLLWRSGRFSGGDFVFYGPAGQDPLFHVTLIQRLLHHVPPDNFIVSGLQAPVYHYFDDLALALALNSQKIFHLGSGDVFDLFYRCYPTIIYFLLGALAYRIGRQLLSTVSGGILGTLLLLGGGGLGWFFGVLQTVAHVSHLSAARSLLFSQWTSWGGVDPILPLVHRPAHYHSLLICLAVLSLLLRPECSRRDWIFGGLLLGLMAGFNFTLAATFGISAALSCVFLWLLRHRRESRDVAWLTVSIFFGSLPMIATMVFSGRHNPAPGFPFRGPNLEFTTFEWGPVLRHVMPGALVPLAALVLFPIVAYGIRLAGIPEMLRLDIGGTQHRGIATVLVTVFLLSFVIGTFFPYKALGGIAVVFIQPTLWILGLFSLYPIGKWLQRNHGNWRPIALWGMLALTWIQTLAAFNLGHKAVFSRDTVSVLQEIRLAAAPDDVVAYLPSGITQQPIWGPAAETTTFAITAFTGLDGYVSSETYTTAFAVPGLRGGDEAQLLAQAEQIYKQRRSDIEAVVKGDLHDPAAARLLGDHVRWIVISTQNLHPGGSSPGSWKETADVAVYRLSP